MNAIKIWGQSRNAISADYNSAFHTDLMVNDDYWIEHDQFGTGDGHCVHRKPLP
jgi:hypothetical protein